MKLTVATVCIYQVDLSDWLPLFRSTAGLGVELFDSWSSLFGMNTLHDNNWESRLTDPNLEGVYKNTLIDTSWESFVQVEEYLWY